MVEERDRAGLVQLFLDFVRRRDRLARHGLSVDDANLMVMTAVGGDNQSVTVEGRERYGINVRYARDYRDDLQALRRDLARAARQRQHRRRRAHQGPAMILKRIAAPMVGGLGTSFLLELLVYPPIYFLWRRRQLRARAA